MTTSGHESRSLIGSKGRATEMILNPTPTPRRLAIRRLVKSYGKPCAWAKNPKYVPRPSEPHCPYHQGCQDRFKTAIRLAPDMEGWEERERVALEEGRAQGCGEVVRAA
jgi:hypothetical protein